MSELFHAQQLFAPGDSGLKSVVLEILHRPSMQAISLKSIAQELIDRYDLMEVERCLLALQEEELVELAYTSGYGVGLRAKQLKHCSLPSGTTRAYYSFE